MATVFYDLKSVLLHIDWLHFIAISVSSFACYFEVYENLFFLLIDQKSFLSKMFPRNLVFTKSLMKIKRRGSYWTVFVVIKSIFTYRHYS